jgi:hypothetical protein
MKRIVFAGRCGVDMCRRRRPRPLQVKPVLFCRPDVLISWPRRPLRCSGDATPMPRQVNLYLGDGRWKLGVGSWELGCGLSAPPNSFRRFPNGQIHHSAEKGNRRGSFSAFASWPPCALALNFPANFDSYKDSRVVFRDRWTVLGRQKRQHLFDAS